MGLIAILGLLSSSLSSAQPASQPTRGAAPGRQLIVVMKRDVKLQINDRGIVTADNADLAPLQEIARQQTMHLRPLFHRQQNLALDALATSRPATAPATQALRSELDRFFKVDAPDDKLDALAAQLRALKAVEAAYVMPRPQHPVRVNQMLASALPAPSSTPDMLAKQVYLNDPPEGIGARTAWKSPGGAGKGFHVIDLEGNWLFNHEDLQDAAGRLVGGATDCDWNHGTAVAGELVASRNGFGINGICYDAHLDGFAIDWGGPQAVVQAADMLQAGDVILLEVHFPGPKVNFQECESQAGYIAAEWWPQYLIAIRYATSKGIIVVEAAGNGGENLDDPLYDAAPDSFGSEWQNPFNLKNPQSGAVLVGAGAAPPNTHGQSKGPDRSRLVFSNYGSRIDAQGYGEEVTTCGYGDSQGGNDPLLWYTDSFGGTSSATPIVAGSLICVEGILKARGHSPLTPDQARDLLRITGSPQQESPIAPLTQRIGNRPDIAKMVEKALQPK